MHTFPLPFFFGVRMTLSTESGDKSPRTWKRLPWLTGSWAGLAAPAVSGRGSGDGWRLRGACMLAATP